LVDYDVQNVPVTRTRA